MGLRDEILLDIQTTTAAHGHLSATQQRLVNLIATIAAGGITAWTAAIELRDLWRTYRKSREGSH